MTRDEMIDFCRRWQEALNQRDFNTLGELSSETAELESPMAGHATGCEAVIRASEGIFSIFPDAALTFEAPIIDDTRIAVVAEVSGTHGGSFMGLPPTGKSMRFKLVFLLDVPDRQIVRDRRLYDFTGLLVQIGVLKAKPA